MSNRLTIVITLLLLTGTFLMHLPFLDADPDIDLSTSRDAFTDEGLNTSQLRNYINHGYFDLMESANLVKTPLFNAMLFLPLKFFGTHLPVARMSILIFFFVALIFLLQKKNFQPIIMALSITTLLQYDVFQYSHFSLSEIISAGWMLLGIWSLYCFAESEFQKQGNLILASLFLALSYYSKIQFVYIAPLIPAVLTVRNMVALRNNETIFPSRKIIFQSAGWMIFFLLLYFMCWYLPNRTSFDYVMRDESSGKFAPLLSIPRTIAFNVVYVLFGKETWMFNLLVLLCFIAGGTLWYRAKDRQFKMLFIIASMWTLFELHKLTMIYLPSRYLVTYYFASGFLSAIVLVKLFFDGNEERTLFAFMPNRIIGFILISCFFCVNMYSYIQILDRRQYHIHDLNEYFTTTLTDHNAVVLGSWAPSLTWDSKVISKPVWNNYMNDENIPEQHAQVIISEPDEAESNQAYASHGINLTALADSSRSFTIGKWNLNVYWIKKE